MTRHTWRPGDAIDPGATYYPMDGARQGDPLEPDDVIAALDAHMEHTGIVDAMAQEIENLRAELDGRAPVAPADHWSPWLEWRGGPCPLPGDVVVEVSFRGEHDDSGIVDEFYWDRRDPNSDIIRFRYRADNPAGWLPRGDWIPPAELWDEGCPVRCEWHSEDEDGALSIQRGIPGVWHNITHIRLVARQPQAGLPEGWRRTRHGELVSPSGRTIFVRENVDQYGGGDVIRQAVDAWLREMGDE